MPFISAKESAVSFSGMYALAWRPGILHSEKGGEQMALLGIGILLFWVLIAPVTVHGTLAASRQITGALVIRVWGVPIVLTGGLCHNLEGKLVLSVHREGGGREHEQDPGSALAAVRKSIRFLRTANRFRDILFKSIHVMDIRCQIRVGTKDAAQTALLTAGVQGALKELGRLIGKTPHHFRVWADFSGRGTAGQADCILFARLGNLLAGTGFALAAYKKAEKQLEEESKWNIPSAI